MRIISGSFKGKKILEPKDQETRPLKDLVKESVFNILTHSNKFRIILKIDSFVKSFRGRVSLFFGSIIFLPLKEPEIILIIQ